MSDYMTKQRERLSEAEQLVRQSMQQEERRDTYLRRLDDPNAQWKFVKPHREEAAVIAEPLSTVQQPPVDEKEAGKQAKRERAQWKEVAKEREDYRATRVADMEMYIDEVHDERNGQCVFGRHSEDFRAAFLHFAPRPEYTTSKGKKVVTDKSRRVFAAYCDDMNDEAKYKARLLELKEQMFSESFGPELFTPEHISKHYTEVRNTLDRMGAYLQIFKKDEIGGHIELTVEDLARIDMLKELHKNALAAFKSVISTEFKSEDMTGEFTVPEQITEEERARLLGEAESSRLKMSELMRDLDRRVAERAIERAMVGIENPVDDEALLPISRLIEAHEQEFEAHREALMGISDDYLALLAARSTYQRRAMAMEKIRSQNPSEAMIKQLDEMQNEVIWTKLPHIEMRIKQMMEGAEYLLTGKQMSAEAAAYMAEYGIMTPETIEAAVRATTYVAINGHRREALIAAASKKHGTGAGRVLAGANMRYLALMEDNVERNAAVIDIIEGLSAKKSLDDELKILEIKLAENEAKLETTSHEAKTVDSDFTTYEDEINELNTQIASLRDQLDIKNTEAADLNKRLSTKIRDAIKPHLERMRDFDSKDLERATDEELMEKSDELQELAMSAELVAELSKQSDPDDPTKTIDKAMFGDRLGAFLLKQQTVSYYAIKARGLCQIKAYREGTLSKDAYTREELEIISGHALSEDETVSPEKLIEHTKRTMALAEVDIAKSRTDYMMTREARDLKYDGNQESYTTHKTFGEGIEAAKAACDLSGSADISAARKEYQSMQKRIAELNAQIDGANEEEASEMSDVLEEIRQLEERCQYLETAVGIHMRGYRVAGDDDEIFSEALFRSFGSIESVSTFKSMPEEEFARMCHLMGQGSLYDGNDPAVIEKNRKANLEGIAIYKKKMSEHYEKLEGKFHHRMPSLEYICTNTGELIDDFANIQVDLAMVSKNRHMIDMDNEDDARLYHLVNVYFTMGTYVTDLLKGIPSQMRAYSEQLENAQMFENEAEREAEIKRVLENMPTVMGIMDEQLQRAMSQKASFDYLDDSKKSFAMQKTQKLASSEFARIHQAGAQAESKERFYGTLNTPEAFRTAFEDPSPVSFVRAMDEYAKATEYERHEGNTAEVKAALGEVAAEYKAIFSAALEELENAPESRIDGFVKAYFDSMEKAVEDYNAAMIKAEAELSEEIQGEDRQLVAAQISLHTEAGRRLARLEDMRRSQLAGRSRISDGIKKYTYRNKEKSRAIEDTVTLYGTAASKFAKATVTSEYLAEDAKRANALRDSIFYDRKKLAADTNGAADDVSIDVHRALEERRKLYEASALNLVNAFENKREGTRVRTAGSLCYGFRTDEKGEVLPEDVWKYEHDKKYVEGMYGTDVEKRKEFLTDYLNYLAGITITDEMLDEKYIISHITELSVLSDHLQIKDDIYAHNKDLLTGEHLPQALLDHVDSQYKKAFKYSAYLNAVLGIHGINLSLGGEYFEGGKEMIEMTKTSFKMNAELIKAAMLQEKAKDEEDAVIEDNIKKNTAKVVARAQALLDKRNSELAKLRQKITAGTASDDEKQLATAMEKRIRSCKISAENADDTFNAIIALESHDAILRADNVLRLRNLVTGDNVKPEYAERFKGCSEALLRDVPHVAAPTGRSGDIDEDTMVTFLDHSMIFGTSARKYSDEQVESAGVFFAEFFENRVRELEDYTKATGTEAMLESSQRNPEWLTHFQETYSPLYKQMQTTEAFMKTMFRSKEYDRLSEATKKRLKDVYPSIYGYYRFSLNSSGYNFYARLGSHHDNKARGWAYTTLSEKMQEGRDVYAKVMRQEQEKKKRNA